MASLKIRVALIGCGGMPRHHIKDMLEMADTTEIAAICEPSDAAYQLASKLFVEAGFAVPPNEPDFGRFLARDFGKLDAVFIITPHAYHFDQTMASLIRGWDVLLEKPMVMNAGEARALIKKRDETGRLLVVAFPGSLSAQIRTAARRLRSGELGKLLSISGTVWQNWGGLTVDTWRQDPLIAGGGFMFDTGAHMLNTVADLAGEDFAEVAAWLDYHGRPVETQAAIMGRLASGALVTINGVGEAIPSCESEIRVYCSKGIIRTGVWGERLDVQRHGEDVLKPVPVPPSLGVWEHFMAVREGRMANPAPPEVGLRMAKLWDAIKESAAKGGVPVKCG
jgi:predicted dehydrogenase